MTSAMAAGLPARHTEHYPGGNDIYYQSARGKGVYTGVIKVHSEAVEDVIPSPSIFIILGNMVIFLGPS